MLKEVNNYFNHHLPAISHQIVLQMPSQANQCSASSQDFDESAEVYVNDEERCSEAESSDTESKRCSNINKMNKKTKQVSREAYLKMVMRLKKEAKYSSLETLSMIMLKRRNLFSISKDIAKKNGIGEHKNYSIIGMRLGFLFHELIFTHNMTEEAAKEEIIQFFESELDDCLQKKYSDSNSQTFIRMVKEKNISDINIFKRVFESDMSFQSVFNILLGLYEKNKDLSLPKRNFKFVEVVTNTIIGAAKYGEGFNSMPVPTASKSIEPSKPKLSLSLNIEESNKTATNMASTTEISTKISSISELLDLASPATIEKFKVVHYEPILNFQEIMEETNQSCKESLLESSMEEDEEVCYYLDC